MREHSHIAGSKRRMSPADDLITPLYILIENCEYGTLKDEMSRDGILVSIRDVKLSENLQMDPELDLTQAVNKVRHMETIKQEQSLVHSATNTGAPSNIYGQFHGY